MNRVRYNLLKRTISLGVLASTAVSPSLADDCNVLDFGAKADGRSNDAAAIQKAMDHCSATGGGALLFPGGRTYLSGPLHLRSNVELRLQPDAVLLASPDEKEYTESAFKSNRGEGMMWISGKDIRNVSITGGGRIDGNGVAFMGAELEDSYELKPVTDFDPRPHVLTLVNASNVRITDLTIGNSAYWTIHLAGCHDVAIDNISLLNNLKIRNGDGIDVDHSRKVRISNCYIESGDDCICLKNRREYEEYGPCEDVVVSNCIMTSRSCAVKIGSENMDAIRRVLFDNCIITDSNRGIGIQNRDEGSVSDVTFSNIQLDCRLFSDVWWGKSEPVYVTSYPRARGDHKDAGWRFPKGAVKGECGPVRDIRFINVFARSENGIFLGCDTPGKIRDISFDNVNVTLLPPPDGKGGLFDRRPCEGEGFVKADASGIYTENVENLNIDKLRITKP